MADGEARGRTLGAVIKEKDEELALFLEMRRREKERGAAAADQLLLSGAAAAAGDGARQFGVLPPAGESFVPAFFVGPPAAVSHAFCSCFDGNPSLLSDLNLWLRVAVEPKPAAYKVAGGGFRKAPGGADDFLNADAGDKNDYDWWVQSSELLLVLPSKILNFRCFLGGCINHCCESVLFAAF